MARPLRIEFPGALYHVTSRGNEKRPIFRSDVDRRAFLDFLAQAARRFGWSITAWVLMTNHFHLVIQTPGPNLSRGMHWLNGTYAARFNKHHRRWGHLFGGRFKAFLIDKETYFMEVLRYTVLNPVRAGMVERPEDYRWSSYRATAGLELAPDWLDVKSALGAFAPDEAIARSYYREFVLSKINSSERLWDKTVAGLYLGCERWIKAVRKHVETTPRSTDHPKAQRAAGRPKMHAVIDAVARAAGVTVASIRAARGGALRRLATWIGWFEGWSTLRSIAASLRLRSEGHISNLIRRCDRELASNPGLLRVLDGSLAVLRV